MARIKITSRFDYRPRPGTIISFKPGTYTMRREAADQATAAGKGELLEAAPRPADPQPAASRRQPRARAAVVK